MARPALVTPESVEAAIAALQARHQAVTLNAVRGEIGGGSLATIQPIVAAWKRGQAVLTTAPVEAPAAPLLDPPPLPERVGQALGVARAGLDGIAAAVTEALAAAEIAERRAAATAAANERKLAGEALALALAQAEADAAAAREELAEIIEDGRRVAAERDSFAAAADELNQTRTTLATREAELAELRRDLAEVQRERDHAQALAARADSATTTAHDQAAATRRDLDHERATNRDLTDQLTAAGQRIAALTAERDGLAGQIDGLRLDHKREVERLVSILDRLTTPAQAPEPAAPPVHPPEHGATPPAPAPTRPPARRSRPAKGAKAAPEPAAASSPPPDRA